MSSGPAILGLGNPLLDISIEVSDTALCTKYGLKMGDAILASDPHKPLYAEIVDTFGPKVQYIAGGATQNSIRVAQWMSGTAGSTAYVGAVGDDAFGRQLKSSAEADGVKALYQVNKEKPTGTCAVIVYEKERSLVANLAACETLSDTYLDSEEVAAAISSARIMYCAGFPLTHPGGAASVVRLGKHCAENGKIFATNLSAPFIVQVRRMLQRRARARVLVRASCVCLFVCLSLPHQRMGVRTVHNPTRPLLLRGTH
jgi:adenosine kinase